MDRTVHLGDTYERARQLMKHIQEASEGRHKKTGTTLIAEAMERLRFKDTRERPEETKEYWRLHPEDLAAELVDLLLREVGDNDE